MGVYLGDGGRVELKRVGLNSSLISNLDPADINTSTRRFSFDFENGALISGDQIEITTTDGSELEFVLDHAGPDGRWFCNVDDVGGLRLYNDFESAINGSAANALKLVEPSRTIPIAVRTRNFKYRPLAKIRDYSITTTRDTIDLTDLGDEFRRHYASGLISGQGTLRCIWDYIGKRCEDDDCPDLPEYANYLAQLVLRLQQGASFYGRFFMAGPWDGRTEAAPGGNPPSLWWDALCIVTNVGMTFSPGNVLETQIEFVCSGPIRLRMGLPPGYLLQENEDLILEEGTSEPLELET